MNTTPESFAMLSNAALVERHLDRDPSAFTELFRRHRDMVYRICLRLTAHHHDAEDLTQETFRRAATAIERWDPGRPLEPWLATIAGNRCRTLLANRRREVNWNAWAEPHRFSAQSDVIETVALHEQISIAMDRLPADQRRAFELVHQHDLSYPQAARLMGRSAGTVKTWVHRAKSSMRAAFEQSEAAGPPTLWTAESADSPRQRTATSAFSKMRRTATVSVASLLLVWCGLSIAPQVRGLLSGSSRYAAVAVSDAAAESRERNVSHALQGDSTNAPRSASDAAIATWPERFDLQWAAFAVFSPPQWTIADVESLEIATWIESSAPTVREVSDGVKPLGRTLRGLASLFSWHQPEANPHSKTHSLLQSAPIESGISIFDSAATDELQT